MKTPPLPEPDFFVGVSVDGTLSVWAHWEDKPIGRFPVVYGVSKGPQIASHAAQCVRVALERAEVECEKIWSDNEVIGREEGAAAAYKCAAAIRSMINEGK